MLLVIYKAKAYILHQQTENIPFWGLALPVHHLLQTKTPCVLKQALNSQIMAHYSSHSYRRHGVVISQPDISTPVQYMVVTRLKSCEILWGFYRNYKQIRPNFSKSLRTVLRSLSNLFKYHRFQTFPLYENTVCDSRINKTLLYQLYKKAAWIFQAAFPYPRIFFKSCSGVLMGVIL